MLTLRLLHASEIDSLKWDACIARASNGLPYAYFHYLNAMADDWMALIAADYRVVMPLPFRQRWGIRYVYRPPFVQRLGIFQYGQPDEDSVKKICYTRALQKFAYVHYSIDAESWTDFPGVKASLKPNYVIDLSKPYELIFSHYHPSLLHSLAKAHDARLRLQSGDVSDAIAFFYTHYQHRIPEMQQRDYARLLRAAEKANPYKILCHQVTDDDGNLLAVAVWLCDGRRMITVLNGCNEAGRAKRAMHFLFDAIIRQYGETQRILDFEGSSLPGVAKFIRSFGPSLETYFTIHVNALPVPFRWLKK